MRRWGGKECNNGVGERASLHGAIYGAFVAHVSTGACCKIEDRAK